MTIKPPKIFIEASTTAKNPITFEKLMYDHGSPGKVFLLDEKSMEDYLDRLERDEKNFKFNKGAGGLRQITKNKKISNKELIKNCFKKVA